MSTHHVPEEDDRIHQVYLARDSAGELLYVGVSWSTAARMGQHKRSAPWWADVANVEIVNCADRTDALKLEEALIRSRGPKHNKQMNDGMATGQAICTECWSLMDWRPSVETVTEHEGILYAGFWACWECLEDTTDGIGVAPPPLECCLVQAWEGWTAEEAVLAVVEERNLHQTPLEDA